MQRVMQKNLEIPAAHLSRVLRCLVVLLLVGSVAAEARLIRGGGRGASSIITDTSAAGSVPVIVPDPDPGDNTVLVTDGAIPALTTGDAQAAAYGFGPVGRPVSIDHAWGRDCSRVIECSFALGRDEFLSWEAVLLGLPGENPTVDYSALADLTITWEFRAIEEPPPDLAFSGPTSSRPLDGLSWSRTFNASSAGAYGDGAGSAAVTLGDDQGYNPAADELSGCYGLQSPDSPLSLTQFYAYGSCRNVGLDLATVGVTGSDLLADLNANEYLSLFVSAELLAPEDFQFASLNLGGPTGQAALLPGADVLTPEELLAAAPGDLIYGGCAAAPSSSCDRVLTNSQGLRVDVVDVPAPGPLALLAGGLLGLFLQRRRRRGVSVGLS